jgi:ketosteroid isomerase-like protein
LSSPLQKRQQPIRTFWLAHGAVSVHPLSLVIVTQRDQPQAAGVPRLIDQYKQRRQAWLAQADELVRLRDEVRSAAEREALEIVTAARRDVRRIVVEARRELLVLTAQLHAAIESVDQASLQAATETAGGADRGRAVDDVIAGPQSLGDTQDLVLGARREVRSVLDEARAEIEALVAEANGPLREIPAALTAAPLPEPPIPTLETILGADPLSTRGPSSPAPRADSGPIPIDSIGRQERSESRPDGDDDHDDNGGGSPRAWHTPPDVRSAVTAPEPFAGGSSGSVALAAPATAAAATLVAPPTVAPATMPAPMLVTRTVDEAVSFVVAPPESPHRFAHFNTVEEPAVEPLSGFGGTGPLRMREAGRTFLADYDDNPRSRPAWMWVGLFAATGIVAIVGTVWWFTLRDSGTALATSIDSADAPPAAAAGPAPGRVIPAATSTVGESGLAIEVRRTAWIRTVVDGKEDSRVYQAGETRQIVGARAVSIRAGDGGAVYVSVDGRPAEALGGSGVAVTKQYSLATGAPVPALATAPAGAAVVEPVAATPPVAAPAQPVAPTPTLAAAPRGPDTSRSNAPVPGALNPGSPTPAAPPAPEPSAASTLAGGGRADLIAAGQQWLDAYQRRDRDAMSSSGTENMTISDERSVTERFPAWQAGVRRDLDQLELELSGDTALLTARMVERNGDNSASSAQHVSRVSQIWVRRAGRWRLADVRIIGEARLNQIVR